MARFIAGAVCPACRAVDRTVVEDTAAGRQRRCVSCGYVDTETPGRGSAPATRFSAAPVPPGGPRRDDAAVESTRVRILAHPARPPHTPEDSTD